MDRLHELRAAALATAFRLEADKTSMSEVDIRYAIEGLTRPGALEFVRGLYARISMFQQDLHDMEAYAAELLDGHDASE